MYYPKPVKQFVVISVLVLCVYVWVICFCFYSNAGSSTMYGKVYGVYSTIHACTGYNNRQIPAMHSDTQYVYSSDTVMSCKLPKFNLVKSSIFCVPLTYYMYSLTRKGVHRQQTHTYVHDVVMYQTARYSLGYITRTPSFFCIMRWRYNLCLLRVLGKVLRYYGFYYVLLSLYMYKHTFPSTGYKSVFKHNIQKKKT